MNLITQTVLDLPVVLIITDQPTLPLIGWIEQLLSEHQVQPFVVAPAAIQQVWQQLQQDGATLYRILLVGGFGLTLDGVIQVHRSPDFFTTQEQHWQLCLQLLSSQAAGVATTAILGRHSWQAPAATHAFVKTLSQLSHQGTWLTDQIQTYLPRSQFFLAWDCLVQSPTSPTLRNQIVSLEMPLLFSIISAQARVLFDPQQTWRLQTLTSLFETIAQQLLKPHQATKILIQGRAELSQVWLGQIQTSIDHYFAYHPTLVPVVLPEQTNVETADIVCQTEADIVSCLDEQIRTLPHALAQLDQLSEFAAAQQKVLRWEPHVVLAGLESGSSIPPVQPKSVPKELPQQLSAEPVGLIKKKTDEKLIQPLKVTTVTPVIPARGETLNLEAELQQLFGKSRGEFRQERLQTKAKVTQKIVAKSKRHKAIFYFGSILTVVGVSLGVLWGGFEISFLAAQRQWQQDLKLLTNQKPLSESKGLTWQTPLKIQMRLYKPFLKEDFADDAAAIIDLDKLIHEYSLQSQEITRQTAVLMTEVTGQKSLELADQLKKLSQVTIQQQQTVDQLAEKLKLLNPDKQSLVVKQEVTQLMSQLQQDKTNLPAATQILAAAPDLLGMKTKQVYTVILQDQRELRPTGGFIQAVGRLTFAKGMLIDHSFQSVYDIDNKLVSQVTPPDEIKRFLGETRWFLRDSNWSPDFPATARQINFFLQDSTGEPTDGVIAISFETVRRLLQATGPLDIPELNEQVSDKNLYDRLEFHAETKSVLVNGQQLDYVSLLLDKLTTKLAALEQDKLADVVTVWSQSFASRDVLMTSFNSSMTGLWPSLGWDGGAIQAHCPNQFLTETCLLDQLYQVDANVGINKVNPYIEKKVVDHVEIQAEKVIHRRTISYRNEAQLDSWPQGYYRVYLKFLLGKGAQTPTLTVNGVMVAPDQLISYLEQGSPVIGTQIQIPRQKTTTVELTYQLKLPYKAPFSYFFFSQKQPGVTETRDVLLSYLPSLKPRLIAPQADFTSQLLNFHLQDDTHTSVGVTFEP